MQARLGAAAEVFPPRGLADGDQLAHLGGGQRQRDAVDDPAPGTARRRCRPALPSPAAAAQGRLPGRPKHHPDYRDRMLLRLYSSSQHHHHRRRHHCHHHHHHHCHLRTRTRDFGIKKNSYNNRVKFWRFWSVVMI